MRIGIDLNLSQYQPRLERRAHLVFSLALFALIALGGGCNAIADFGDFKFGPGAGDQRDSGAVDSGLAADGGETDAAPPGSDSDGSVTTGDGGTVSDGSVTGDASTGADGSVADGGDHDAGGNTDSGMMSCPSSVEICDNNVDDDCDTHSDCDDDDCTGQGSCCSATAENTQLACSDGRDNDCSGQKDCDDLNCSGTLNCCMHSGDENTMLACGNGIDDDCDGKVDCADPECAGLAACCGIVAAGGGGGGVVAGCCSPDGMSDTDQPNDGKDNDCDGLVDIPILLSAFPTQGLPSSADEVRLNFTTEINPSATLACSTKRPGQLPAFSACPLMGTSVKPFTAPQSADGANNGLWITQVRWDFPDGQHSSSYTFKYYVHNSLNGVAHCAPFHTDPQWLAVAHTRLGTQDAGAFKRGIDTYVTAPFFRVTYELPLSGLTQYQLDGKSHGIDMWSLRRRFTIGDADPWKTSRYLLITRNYKATRSGSCKAASLRVHMSKWKYDNRNNFHSYTCDAIAINRAGVGVCMNNGTTSGANPVFSAGNDSHDSRAPGGWQDANKFMWRNLLEGANVASTFVNPMFGLRNFMPKCSTESCTGGLYLPDRARFNP